jgi:hypothetical protein
LSYDEDGGKIIGSTTGARILAGKTDAGNAPVMLGIQRVKGLLGVGLGTAFWLLGQPCSAMPVAASAEIRAAIDESLNRVGRISDEQRFAPVMKFGAAAVPGVIERYAAVTGRQRDSPVVLLCHLGTPEARKFLKKIVGEMGDARGMDSIFMRYPMEHFDEIMSEAVEVEGAGIPCFFAGERAKEAVRRNPRLAGVIVAALKEQPPVEHYNFRIGSLLQEITGWSAWQFDGRAENDRNQNLGGVIFWRNWWSRNQDRTLYEWLVEAYRAHPESASQKSGALQCMSLLRDKRTVPICLEALDDADDGVRYWSVCVLKKIEGDQNGYTFEKFKAEERVVITRLKAGWSGR